MTEEEIFKLYETHGVPIEITEHILKRKIDRTLINTYMHAHKELSKSDNNFIFETNLGRRSGKSRA